jgi:hypothetical protein
MRRAEAGAYRRGKLRDGGGTGDVTGKHGRGTAGGSDGASDGFEPIGAAADESDTQAASGERAGDDFANAAAGAGHEGGAGGRRGLHGDAGQDMTKRNRVQLCVAIFSRKCVMRVYTAETLPLLANGM